MIAAREGYELWAETWDATPSPVVAVEERVTRAWLDRVRAERVVDVGCGTGRWAQQLGALGFDVSPAMLAVAAEKPGLRGRVAVADGASLPVASGVADLVVCALTLGHVPRLGEAVRELVRVLRPGGVLVLTDFHPEASARGWRRTFRHNGRVYELEHYPYGLDEIAGELRLVESCEGWISEAERELFEAAGRPELFAAACEVPVVQASRWVRS